jgi:hypothetical protein
MIPFARGIDMNVVELARELSAVDSGVLLVPPRILRRVIKRDREVAGLGLRVPHHQLYWIARDALLRTALRAELGLPPDGPLPETFVLLSRPYRLGSTPVADLLFASWRKLFHARVHLTFADLRKNGGLSDTVLSERIAAIGATEFREIEAVLRQENLLLPPASPADIYEEFAALYLELRFFDPDRVRWYFPGVCDFSAIDDLLSQDLDVDALRHQTRPPGARDPLPSLPARDLPDGGISLPGSWLATEPDAERFNDLMQQAGATSQRQNQVRAMVLYRQALAVAPPNRSKDALKCARDSTQTLLNRLAEALQLPAGELNGWREGLAALLLPAGEGRWTVEARLLYDLQKVCIEHERPVAAVDLIETIVTWFRRPVKRLLPAKTPVLIVGHLRSARDRLPGARLPDRTRHALGALLRHALHRGENRLRSGLRPRLESALDTVGLTPRDTAERLARQKLIEELLDHIVERGFLTLGGLRDALARNRMKLPDLSGPIEFFTGDVLIRANRRLSVDLDGVYRRGEIYLRWLQRLSSLAFGNPIGRFLTLYLILPVGGAFFTLKGIDGIIEEIHKFIPMPVARQELIEQAVAGVGLFLPTPSMSAVSTVPLAASVAMLYPRPAQTFSVTWMIILAIFYLALIHRPRFRWLMRVILGRLWRGLRLLLVDLPTAVASLPLVRHFLQGRLWLFLYQWGVKPGMAAALVGVLLWWFRVDRRYSLVLMAEVFVLVAMLVNLPLGRYLEEIWADQLVRSWQLLHENVLPGLYRAIVQLSRWALDALERLFYTVDELLRFRTGEGRVTFTFKLILGLVWWLIAYIVRFGVNLLIEPQINPIKHFPVVTVSHKLMLVILDPVAKAVNRQLHWGINRTRFAVGSVMALIPGMFGFLVWELKENWRLYRANQSPTLDPVMVGEHGERMIDLIRPGFHSGTLPRLFARLRQARGAAERKAVEQLLRVEEEVRHFVERELIVPLHASKAWPADRQVSLGKVRLATNRIRIELCCPGVGSESALLDFENAGGQLLAGFTRPGWLGNLTVERCTLSDLLAGFYKLAGVRLLRGTETPFTTVAVRWNEWAQMWESDQAGGRHEPPLLPEFELVPERV